MKKILFLIALVCGVSYGVNAQTWSNQAMTYVVAGDDTATDTDVILLQSPTGFAGNYDLSVLLSTVRVSGTLAATVYCQGSEDGTNWVTLVVDDNVSPSVTDTATITNAATAKAHFVYRSLPYKYFRLSYNSSNTGVSAPTATIYYRKRD